MGDGPLTIKPSLTNSGSVSSELDICGEDCLEELQGGVSNPSCEDKSTYVKADQKVPPPAVPKASSSPDVDSARLLLDDLTKEVYEWDSPDAEPFIAYLQGVEYVIEISPKTALTNLRNIEKVLSIAKKFDLLPKEIKGSELGQNVHLEIESLIGLISDGIDESDISSVSAHVEILKRYQNYEEGVRKPAQERLKAYYPKYLPVDRLDFEYTLKNNYRDAFDYKMLDNLPICRAYRSLDRADRMELCKILSALRSSGYDENNLMENPLSGVDIEKIDGWIGERKDILNGDAIKRLFSAADKIAGEESKNNGFAEGARLRLRVEEGKQFVKELRLIRTNFGKLDEKGKGELRVLLLDVLREIEKREEERAKRNLPAPDLSEAGINELFFGKEETNTRDPLDVELGDLPSKYLMWLDGMIAKLERGQVLTEDDLVTAEKLIAGGVQGDVYELSRQADVSGNVAAEVNGIEVPTDGSLNDETFVKQVDSALSAIDAASLQEGILEAKKVIDEMLASEKNMMGISDYEEDTVKNDLRRLSTGYEKALMLLAKGDYEGARNLYLSLAESYHQKAAFKLFSEYQEVSARNKFYIRMGSITASVALGGVATTVLLGEAATALSAGQMMAMRLLVESGVFVGSQKILNNVILDERLYDPEKGFWANAADYGLEYLETVGMFGVTRRAHLKYERSVGGWLFRNAEKRLEGMGKIAKGAARTDEVARAMVEEEMKSGWRGVTLGALYKIEAGGTEYKAFKGYEFLQAAVEDSTGIREGDPLEVFSAASMGETLKTLVCLKLGGVLARPITVPMTEKTARVMLARHKPALDTLEADVRNAQTELKDYVENNVHDPARLEAIRKRLADCLTKRQKLIQVLVTAGISAPEILAQTNAALAEASRAPRDAKALDELLKRVEAKDESTWKYDPSDKAYVDERLTELTKDSPERLSEENGTYLLRFPGDKKLIIRPKASSRTGGVKPEEPVLAGPAQKTTPESVPKASMPEAPAPEKSDVPAPKTTVPEKPVAPVPETTSRKESGGGPDAPSSDGVRLASVTLTEGRSVILTKGKDGRRSITVTKDGVQTGELKFSGIVGYDVPGGRSAEGKGEFRKEVENFFRENGVEPDVAARALFGEYRKNFDGTYQNLSMFDLFMTLFGPGKFYEMASEVMPTVKERDGFVKSLTNYTDYKWLEKHGINKRWAFNYRKEIGEVKEVFRQNDHPLSVKAENAVDSVFGGVRTFFGAIAAAPGAAKVAVETAAVKRTSGITEVEPGVVVLTPGYTVYSVQYRGSYDPTYAEGWRVATKIVVKYAGRMSELDRETYYREVDSMTNDLKARYKAKKEYDTIIKYQGIPPVEAVMWRGRLVVTDGNHRLPAAMSEGYPLLIRYTTASGSEEGLKVYGDTEPYAIGVGVKEAEGYDKLFWQQQDSTAMARNPVTRPVYEKMLEFYKLGDEGRYEEATKGLRELRSQLEAGDSNKAVELLKGELDQRINFLERRSKESPPRIEPNEKPTKKDIEVHEKAMEKKAQEERLLKHAANVGEVIKAEIAVAYATPQEVTKAQVAKGKAGKAFSDSHAGLRDEAAARKVVGFVNEVASQAADPTLTAFNVEETISVKTVDGPKETVWTARLDGNVFELKVTDKKGNVIYEDRYDVNKITERDEPEKPDESKVGGGGETPPDRSNKGEPTRGGLLSLFGKGKKYEPTIVATAHMGPKNMESDKALIRKAYKKGARKIGLELTRKMLDSGVSNYFTDLARYAESLGMEVVPLVSEGLYDKMYALTLAKKYISRKGGFDTHAIGIDILVKEGEISSASPKADTSGMRRELAHLRMALEIIERVGGDVDRFAEEWDRVMVAEASNEMARVAEGGGLDIVVTGRVHAEELARLEKGFTLERAEADKHPDKIVQRIMDEMAMPRDYAENVYRFLMGTVREAAEVKEVSLTKSEQRKIVVAALDGDPRIVMFTVKTLQDQNDGYVSVLDPLRSLEALKVSCDDANEIVTNIIGKYLEEKE